MTTKASAAAAAAGGVACGAFSGDESILALVARVNPPTLFLPLLTPALVFVRHVVKAIADIELAASSR